MKTHSTNYFNTFIEIAEDTKVASGTIPPSKSDKKTIAELQYQLIAKHPYVFSSDDVLFQVFAERNELSSSELVAAKTAFFSKGQACFRASPLTKSYGFGVHSNSEGKIALFPCESDAYQQFLEDPAIKKVKAMKSKR
ncbi:MAG: hypothetical protein IT221_09250 [Fluviicola sp.]|nr:hypothetical protein [Fluviicola sp.]